MPDDKLNQPGNQDPGTGGGPGASGDAPKFNKEEILKEYGGSEEKFYQAHLELKKSSEKYKDYDSLKDEHTKYKGAIDNLTPLLQKLKIKDLKALEQTLQKTLTAGEPGMGGDKTQAGKGVPKIDWSELTSQFKVDPEFLDAFGQTILKAIGGQGAGQEGLQEFQERLLEIEADAQWNEFYFKNKESLGTEIKAGKEEELRQILWKLLSDNPILIKQSKGNLFDEAYSYLKFKSNPDNLKKAKEAGRKLSEIEEHAIDVMAAASDQGKGGSEKKSASDKENADRALFGLPPI